MWHRVPAACNEAVFTCKCCLHTHSTGCFVIRYSVYHCGKRVAYTEVIYCHLEEFPREFLHSFCRYLISPLGIMLVINFCKLVNRRLAIGLKTVVEERRLKRGSEAMKPIDVHRRFGGTYCLHLQSRRVSQATNRQNSACFTYSSALKMETTISPETSRRLHGVTFRKTALLIVTAVRASKQMYITFIMNILGFGRGVQENGLL
jgi:hypothetical protein